MKHVGIIILMILTGFLSAYVLTSYAAVNIPGTSDIQAQSIGTSIASNGSIDSIKTFGFEVLGVIRVVVSGFAIIYLVMIGVYMIIGSNSEETIKTQRKQITYALIGFLFLNVPSLVYIIISPETVNASISPVSDWSSTYGSFFWDTAGFEGIIGNLIAFLKVFIFGAAVLMFTWGLFYLIMSAGDDEKKKKATNRIIYGFAGLIFVGFVDLWGYLVAAGDFSYNIPNVTGTLFKLVLFFAAPITIFMLFIGAYYFITSSGDEEKMKKGKSILINTGIAVVILLAALSFLTDLITFQL